jgi:GT2 family glycosyltransferase
MNVGAVSVLTLVRDRVAHLDNLAAGLRRSDRPPLELIVAWMGGADPQEALAAPAPFATRVIEVGGEVLPLARARNELARAARGELLVFLDVDCVPGAELVGSFVAALDDLDAVAVGRTLYLPPGAGSEDEPRLLELASEHRGRMPLFAADLSVDHRHDLFWSLSFALRRQSFLDRIGGFDEGYRGYGIEDTDFAMRARRCQIPLAWVRGALAFHQNHPPTRLRADAVPALVGNVRRFQRAWGSWPARGWLEELARADLIRWDEEAGEIEALA